MGAANQLSFFWVSGKLRLDKFVSGSYGDRYLQSLFCYPAPISTLEVPSWRIKP